VKGWAGGFPGLIGGILTAGGTLLPWLSVYAGLYRYPAIVGTHGKLLFAAGLLTAALGAVLVLWPRRPLLWGVGLLGFGELALAGYLTAQLLAATWGNLSHYPFLVVSFGPGPVVSLVGAGLSFLTLFLAPPASSLPAPGSTGNPRPAQWPS